MLGLGAGVLFVTWVMGIQGRFEVVERKMDECTKDSVISVVASLFCLTPP